MIPIQYKKKAILSSTFLHVYISKDTLLFSVLYNFMLMGIFVYMNVCVPCACRGKYHIPWNWS